MLENAQKQLTADHGTARRIFSRGELGADLDSLDKKLDDFGARFRVTTPSCRSACPLTLAQTNRLVDIQVKQVKVAADVTKILDTVSVLENWFVES